MSFEIQRFLPVFISNILPGSQTVYISHLLKLSLLWFESIVKDNKSIISWISKMELYFFSLLFWSISIQSLDNTKLHKFTDTLSLFFLILLSWEIGDKLIENLDSFS